MNDKKFGRYELREELGRGGMATVFLAYDPLFDREVAIKVLPREFLHDPMFKTRFDREAKTVASLEHPAIVPVYDFGEEDGQPFLVMRYMPGGTLADRIKNGELSLSEVEFIINGIAPALDLAHSQGIIHRDLKPANILFDNQGNPYLSDFGIVKISQATAVTGSVIIGTPAYMSPEQAQAKSDIDGRSDVYSLGVVLFEMITGRMPYEADSPFGIALMHISEPVPNVREFTPDIPAETQDVLKRAMAKDTAERYATAQELAQAITTIVRETGEIPVPDKTQITPDVVDTLIEAPIEPVPEVVESVETEIREKRTIPRKTLVWIGITGVGIISLSVLSYWFFFLRGSAAQIPETSTVQVSESEETEIPIASVITDIPATQIQPTNEQAATAQPIEPTISPTAIPEATEIPTMEATSRAITIDNYSDASALFSIDEGQIRHYPPAFSPDGNWLAISNGDHTVSIWNVNEGTLITNFQAHQSQVNCIDFSPDGNYLVTGSNDTTLKLWQVGDWSEVRTFSGHTSFVMDCEFSTNNELLVSGGADKRVLVWDVAEGEIRHELAQISLTILIAKFSPDSSFIAVTSGQPVLRIWNTNDGSSYRTIGAQISVYSVAFSPDGNVIAGAPNSQWSRITFWDLVTGDIIGTGSETTVSRFLEYSSDGQLLFSLRDNSILIWQTSDGELLHELTSNTSDFSTLEISDDGSMLAVTTYDGEIIIWGLPQE